MTCDVALEVDGHDALRGLRVWPVCQCHNLLLVALSLGRRTSTHPDKTTDGAAGFMRADGLEAACGKDREMSTKFMISREN
jgi:hypothetical protein